MPTWFDITADFARTHGVHARWVEVLAALASPNPRGGPPPPREAEWTGSFESLEAAAFPTPVLTDVDAEQAAMFLRRIDAVRAELSAMEGPEARILAVGLKVRLAGMAEEPVASRVRALADFYYSQAAQLTYLQRGQVQPLEAVSLHWNERDGLAHARVDQPGPMGPMHINVLRIDPKRVRPRVVDLRCTGGDLVAACRDADAVAGISGGFFLYSEPDIAPPSQRGDPVGLLVCDGVVHNPPFLPRGALLAGDGWVDVGVVGIEGAHTRARGECGPDTSGTAWVGCSLVAQGRNLPIPLNGAVLTRPLEAEVVFEGRRVMEGIAGGPMLVREGQVDIDLRREGFWGSAPPITFSQDETGDRNLLPRMAVGIDAQGRVVISAVDGRDFRRALGMTLAQLGEWMVHLGCVRAVNLDGGSSKRMVVRGRMVDLSSTEVARGARPAPMRPVRTAILWK